jgi:hypothetical protein
LSIIKIEKENKMQIEDFFKLANKSIEEFETQTKNLNALHLINHEKINGVSFIYYITKNNNINLMNHLLNKYHDKMILNHLTLSKENILHITSSVEMFNILMNTPLKSHIYDTDNKGNTLLHKYISNFKLLEKIKPFFEDINIVNDNNQSPLAFFRLSRKVDEFIQLYELFDKKINLNITNNKGIFIPFALFEKYETKEIKKLLDLGIDFTQKDENNNTLFHFIAKSNALCQKLPIFEKGHSIYRYINDKNNENKTAAQMCLNKHTHIGLGTFIHHGLELNADEIEDILSINNTQYKYLFRSVFLNYFQKSNLVFDTIIQGNLLNQLNDLVKEKQKDSTYIGVNFLERMKIFDAYYEKIKLESVMETSSNQKRKMKI